MPLSNYSPRRIQHIFNENPIPGIRAVDEHMGHSTHQFAILKDGTAAHECVNIGTTFFSVNLQKVYISGKIEPLLTL